MARVMIVDDSPTGILQLSKILTNAGHSVVEASDGAEALERVPLEMPECIVMDVVMPKVNGFQATRKLSKDPKTADIPIIVVSSKNQQTDRLWAMRQGARAYVTKPVEAAEFLAKVKDVLEK